MKKSFIDKLLETIQFIAGLVCIIVMTFPALAFICWLINGCYGIKAFDTASVIFITTCLPLLVATFVTVSGAEKLLLWLKQRKEDSYNER